MSELPKVHSAATAHGRRRYPIGLDLGRRAALDLDRQSSLDLDNSCNAVSNGGGYADPTYVGPAK